MTASHLALPSTSASALYLACSSTARIHYIGHSARTLFRIRLTHIDFSVTFFQDSVAVPLPVIHGTYEIVSIWELHLNSMDPFML